jgi:hypothetical protein
MAPTRDSKCATFGMLLGLLLPLAGVVAVYASSTVLERWDDGAVLLRAGMGGDGGARGATPADPHRRCQVDIVVASGSAPVSDAAIGSCETAVVVAPSAAWDTTLSDVARRLSALPAPQGRTKALRRVTAVLVVSPDAARVACAGAPDTEAIVCAASSVDAARQHPVFAAATDDGTAVAQLADHLATYYAAMPEPTDEVDYSDLEAVVGDAAATIVAALGHVVRMTGVPPPVPGAPTAGAAAAELQQSPVWTRALLLPPEHLLVLHLPLGLPIFMGAVVAIKRALQTLRP